MKAKNLTKRVFSLLLALVMVLTMALAAPVPAEAASVNYRILHLDNGRKYFTVDWIKALITEMKVAGFTHLELAFGNDGLRFLLDDMSVGSYSDDAVTNAIKKGNLAYNNKKGYSTNFNELTQADMDEIIAHANQVGIEIIPLLNNPGHMYTLITAMTNLGMTPGYNGSASTVDLQDTEAVNFVKGLLQKYVNYFSAKGCTVFNIGADEYANDNYSNGSMGFGHLLSRGKYQLFVDYVNSLNAMIKAAGMKTMAFNDGIYFQSKTSYAFDKDIMISFWTSGWGSGSSAYKSASASTMASKGHPMINTHGDYYYILGVNDIFTPGTAAYHADGYHTQASKFTNTTFMGSTVSNPAGSMFCVWADYPGAETETEIARYIRPIMRVIAARMKDSNSYDVNTVVEGGFNADGTINVPVHTHTYQAVTVNPTCESAGYTTYTCTGCEDSYTETIPALGHNYKAVTTDATCTTVGSTVYTCANCGDSYKEEIPALGHDYETVTVAATCTKPGSVTTTCATCGDKTVETIPALGHEYKTTTVAATCTTAGYTTYSCVNCGNYYNADYTAALGHSYTVETKAATCTEDGGSVYTCTACGDSYTADKVAAFGHTYRMTTVEATCETAGSVTKICETCGDKVVETIPALGHNYETVTVEPTCTTAGSASKVCTICGDKTVETIPALGHDYKTTTVAATCTTAGSVTKTCAVCGDKTVETIPALGHNYKKTTVAATCETAGSVTTTCVNCGDKTVETIPALGHSYTATTVAATCTTGGYTSYKCNTCGNSYTSNQTAALGHSYSSTTVAPTCTAGGYTYHKCDACGDSYTSSQTAALGHNYTSQQVGNDMVYTCTNCGHSYSESLAKNYTYDKVTSFASGDSYVITLYSGRKYYAVTHSNNTLAVKQVTVSGNKITTEITDDMLWDYNGSKLSYKSGNNTVYLYAKTTYGGWFGWNSTTTLTLSTTNSSTVSFSSSKLKVGSSYLRYNYGSVSLNRSATTSYLFKQNEE